VITRLYKFLKDTYYREVELPTANKGKLYKSFEYRFLKPYFINININNEYDINRYLNTPRVKYKLKAKED
jgi:hypothetical protein